MSEPSESESSSSSLSSSSDSGSLAAASGELPAATTGELLAAGLPDSTERGGGGGAGRLPDRLSDRNGSLRPAARLSRSELAFPWCHENGRPFRLNENALMDGLSLLFCGGVAAFSFASDPL